MKKHLLLLMVLLAGGLVAQAQSPVIQFDSLRELTELNGVLSGVYGIRICPWLSPNGQRLYFSTSGTGTDGQLFWQATRRSSQAQFDTLSEIDNFQRFVVPIWPSPNELEVWGGIPSTPVVYEHYTRQTDTSAFIPDTTLVFQNLPHPIIMQSWFSLSPNGQEFFLAVKGSYWRFTQASPGTFTYADSVAGPVGRWMRRGQLASDGLTFTFSADSVANGGFTDPQLFQMRRPTQASSFGTPERILITGRSGGGWDPFYLPAYDQLAFAGLTPAGQYGLWIASHSRQVLSVAPGLSLPSFTLSPNPAHGTVRLRGAPATSVQVLDVLGRVVHHALLNVPDAPLDLRGLPPGFYTVRCGTQARRLVVE